MVKKHVACFALIRFEVLVITFVYLWILLFSFLLAQGKYSYVNIIIPSGLYGIALLINFIMNHNAFVRFSINDQGISNQSIFMKWEDIQEYDILEIKYRRLPVLFRKRVYCFGDIPNDSFYSLNSKKTIFFSITPKIMAELQLLSKGRSEAINHISERYAGR